MYCSRCDKDIDTDFKEYDFENDCCIPCVTDVWDDDDGDNAWCLPSDMGDKG